MNLEIFRPTPPRGRTNGSVGKWPEKKLPSSPPSRKFSTRRSPDPAGAARPRGARLRARPEDPVPRAPLAARAHLRQRADAAR